MAGSLNKVTLIGNLGRDPEVRNTQDGRMIVNLNLATTESWKDRQSGERRDKTEWHRIVIFSEGLAKVAQQYLRKGMRVYIEGQLQTRKWTDAQGIEKYTTEIVLQNFNSQLIMLDRSGGQEGYNGGNDRNYDNNVPWDNSSIPIAESPASSPAAEAVKSNLARNLDDDIPF